MIARGTKFILPLLLGLALLGLWQWAVRAEALA